MTVIDSRIPPAGERYGLLNTTPRQRGCSNLFYPESIYVKVRVLVLSRRIVITRPARRSS